MQGDDAETILAEETYSSEDDGGVTDTLKRALSSGVRSVLNTEENIRAIAGGILRNEKVEAVSSAVNGLREDLVRVAGREFVKYLDRLNLTDEVVRVLTSISLELKTEIRFIPNDKQLVTPDVKAAVKVKSGAKSGATSGAKKPKRAASKKTKKAAKPRRKKTAAE